MELLAAGHDGAVQMIDISVVRVLQHGACIGVSRPDTTNSHPTIWRSSNSHQSEFGYALMSPRPNYVTTRRANHLAPVRFRIMGCLAPSEKIFLFFRNADQAI